jgi:hypothetical protein
MSLLAVWILVTLCPGGAGADAEECPRPSPDAARAELRALNQQYIDAARSGDEAWFREHMAESVVVILGGGRRLEKPEFLAMVREEPSAFRSLIVRGVTVRLFGPTAQVDADAPWELEDGRTGVSRYIDTYAWLDCRWRVISAQITLLPRPGSP